MEACNPGQEKVSLCVGEKVAEPEAEEEARQRGSEGCEVLSDKLLKRPGTEEVMSTNAADWWDHCQSLLQGYDFEWLG